MRFDKTNPQDHQAPAVILLFNNAPSGALVHPLVIGFFDVRKSIAGDEVP
jgi:hypothetical protein